MSDEKLEQLHSMAQELLTNNNQATSLRAMAAMTSGGYDFADTLHNIYLDFGYPANLTFSNFWNMYRRFGVAKSVIEMPINTTWSTMPTIEASDVFLSELDRLNSRINFWQRMKGLDTRQRVGRYAGIFMRVRDGKKANEPIEGGLPGQMAIAEMIPLYESQLEVISSDDDPNSDNFGKPILLQYSQSTTGNRNEEANNTISIHASRIVFAAEGADDGSIYGVPALEAIYNSLMDLRKVIGGGAEGFYKNAAQSIVFNLKDTAGAQQYKDKLDNFSEQFDDFTRNRQRRAMWTPGMDAKALESSLTNPVEFFNIALNDVSAGSGIPSTILIGKQTGRLASEEDSIQYLSSIQSRRENFVTEMVGNVIAWLIDNGAVPASDFEIVWDDLLARSDSDKLEAADKMSTINEKQFRSGGAMPFNGDEIRETAGFEPAEMFEPGDESLEDE